MGRQGGSVVKKVEWLVVLTSKATFMNEFLKRRLTASNSCNSIISCVDSLLAVCVCRLSCFPPTSCGAFCCSHFSWIMCQAAMGHGWMNGAMYIVRRQATCWLAGWLVNFVCSLFPPVVGFADCSVFFFFTYNVIYFPS